MKIDRIKLIAEMARQRITLKELSEKAGVSRVTITAIRGGKSCQTATGKCLAAALGVDLSELLEDQPDNGNGGDVA